MSDFVVTAVRYAARRRIEEAHIIRLAVDDQRRSAEALLNPPPLEPAMERAKEIHRRLTPRRNHAASCVELPGSHDRTQFTCGIVALGRYLREQATQDVRRRATAC